MQSGAILHKEQSVYGESRQGFSHGLNCNIDQVNRPWSVSWGVLHPAGRGENLSTHCVLRDEMLIQRQFECSPYWVKQSRLSPPLLFNQTEWLLGTGPQIVHRHNEVCNAAESHPQIPRALPPEAFCLAFLLQIPSTFLWCGMCSSRIHFSFITLPAAFGKYPTACKELNWAPKIQDRFTMGLLSEATKNWQSHIDPTTTSTKSSRRDY